MYQPLIDAMKNYFKAGLAMDLETMDSIYAPDFENVRIDRKGNVVILIKAQFMERFSAMKDLGQSQDPIDDVEYLTTTIYDNHGSVLIRRIKEGKSVLYNFVWRLQNGNPTVLIREFTVDEDISYLVEIIQKAQANSATK